MQDDGPYTATSYASPPGLGGPAPEQLQAVHFRMPEERPFLKEERGTTTVLFGGLSPTHDHLVEAALKGIGLNAQSLTPTAIDYYHIGKEYCNNGLCNPVYFMVGRLICYLRELENAGRSKAEIIEHYVFFTIGSNAPCRLGLLETQYRMALADSGFEGFRVLVFQNDGGIKQKSRGDGIALNPEFFLAVVNALNLADLISELGFATRPFEVHAGQTNAVLKKAEAFLYEKLATKKRIQLRGLWQPIFDRLHLSNAALVVYRFWDQITGAYYVDALREVRAMFDTIEIDRFKSKTVVKITGEFWAVTTIGAGNFNIYRFLESEGAVLLVEPVTAFVQFMFSKGILRHINRKKILLKKGLKHRWDIKTRILNYLRFQKKLRLLQLGNALFRREHARLMKALGGDTHMLIEQPILQQLANDFYNINIEGGEGYMEIAKNIYYHEQRLCHMVISLKPFGCMPSTQSDGAQAAVTELNRDMIYLPIETAGEGETNAQSRVLMALSDAMEKAKQEVADARINVRTRREDLEAYVNRHPELKSPVYVVPRRNGTVNMAANFMYHIDALIQRSPNPKYNS